MSLLGNGVLKINGYSYPVLITNMDYTIVDNHTEFSGYLVGRGEPEPYYRNDFLAKTFNLPKPTIKNVIFNNPATVVMWSDGTKVVVKCQPGDVYSKETGLALCIAKKFLGNKGNFNDVFKQWIHEEVEPVEEISVDKMRKRLEDMCNSRECYATASDRLDCPLSTHKCSCNFMKTHYMPMSDEEIREAHKIVFERKEK